MTINEHQKSDDQVDISSAAQEHAQSAQETENEILKAAQEEIQADNTQDQTQINRIAELEEQVAASKDQTLRALAELENTRRRAQKDREEAGAYGISRFARDLLSVSDNLRRAIDAIPEDLKNVDERIGSMIAGIEATEKELLKVFSQNGIQKIEPVDEKFNANFHEVMFEAAVPGKEAGIIIQVVEPGYVLKDRLLRAAKVGVAKGGSVDPQAKSSKDESAHIIDEQA